MGKLGWGLLTFFCLMVGPNFISASSSSSKTPKYWSTAYYLGQWATSEKPDAPHITDIDFSAITHLIYYGLVVHPTGSIDSTKMNVDSKEARDLIALAHQKGSKVLISTGGYISSDSYRDAVTGKNLNVLLDNFEKIILSVGFDGIDVDWEPITTKDYNSFAAFIVALRVRLDGMAIRSGRDRFLLTAATIDAADLFGSLQKYFDQINLMTYDLAGAWDQMTWFNSALYGQGKRDVNLQNQLRFLNSVDSEVRKFVDAGVSPRKIGIGIDFYGYAWVNGRDVDGQAVVNPRQKWVVQPRIEDNVSYSAIMAKYFSLRAYHWDKEAKVPYLSVADSDGDSLFISYENEKSCDEKIRYLKANNLGGIMIWELGGGWRPQTNHPDSLLQAIKKSLGFSKK